jgi:hypothetical protein
MDRRLVVSTEPLASPADGIRRVISVSSVVREVLEVVGDRLYRFEDNAAAHILGLDLPLDFVHVSVLGDPNNLDELALRATGRDGRREVTTLRGGTLRPQIKFNAALAAIAIEVTAAPRDHVLVSVDGTEVRVAPMEDVRVQPLL